MNKYMKNNFSNAMKTGFIVGKKLFYEMYDLFMAQ